MESRNPSAGVAGHLAGPENGVGRPNLRAHKGSALSPFSSGRVVVVIMPDASIKPCSSVRGESSTDGRASQAHGGSPPIPKSPLC